MEDINFKDKKALVRVDFNVPLNEKHEIQDDTRIQATLPTIRKILDDGGAAILMAHLGKPKGKEDQDLSFKHILGKLQDSLNAEVKFAPDCIGEAARMEVENLKSGQVLMLENLRFHKEEKEGDESFAKELASFGDIYINDAFGAAHRAHASTTVVAQFFEEKALGYLMKKEQENADTVLKRAGKPLTVVLGGAKVSDKIAVIENLLDKIDNLIIGGGMAYTFIKTLGGEVGTSKVEEDKLDMAMKILDMAAQKGVKVYLPEDSIIGKEISDEETKTCDSKEIAEEYKGLDIGPKARNKFTEIISKSRTILWNGPMGVFEKELYAGGTRAIALAIAKATQENKAFSLVGGGETSSALQQFGYYDDISFVSTGGGALLEYMEGKELPGIAAIGN